jgi:hypothetical protein
MALRGIQAPLAQNLLCLVVLFELRFLLPLG